jgi:hypothetical protein
MKRLVLPITCGLMGVTVRPLGFPRIAVVFALLGVMIWYAIEVDYD